MDSPAAVTKEVGEVLEKKELKACRSNRSGQMKCFVSDDVEGFSKSAGIFLKEKVSVKKVVL